MIDYVKAQELKVAAAIQAVRKQIVDICGDTSVRINVHRVSPTDHISVRIQWKYNSQTFALQKSISASILLERTTSAQTPINLFIELLLKELKHSMGRIEYEY